MKRVGALVVCLVKVLAIGEIKVVAANVFWVWPGVVVRGVGVG